MIMNISLQDRWNLLDHFLSKFLLFILLVLIFGYDNSIISTILILLIIHTLFVLRFYLNNIWVIPLFRDWLRLRWSTLSWIPTNICFSITRIILRRNEIISLANHIFWLRIFRWFNLIWAVFNNCWISLSKTISSLDSFLKIIY